MARLGMEAGFSQLNVLIIEDNHIDLEVVRQHILQSFPDCNIVSATTLKESISLLEKTEFNFIILDLNLPDSVGLATLKEIVKAAAAVPILVYTGIEDSGIALEALKLGAQDYLLKGRGDHYTLKRVIQFSIERQSFQMQMKHSEQMLRMFIHHSPAGIVVFDKDFRILIVSDRWKSEHGLSDKDVEKSKPTDLLHRASNQWYTMFQRCLSGEMIRCDEDVFITNEGKSEYVKWEMMPWYDERGRVGGVVQFSEFITQQRALRRELEEANNSLEHKVSERTRELEVAINAAQAAQNAKSEFFANITHELRTPLHAIINFSNFGAKKIAQRDDKPLDLDKIGSYFGDIHKSGHRLLTLVNDLLDLTKLQHKNTLIKTENVAVSELFERVCAELSALLETQRMHIKIVLDIKPALALCDPQQIHQVLVNLISNATKFSSPDSTITLAARSAQAHKSTAASTNQLLISVQDRGAGIPEEELESVFDEFKQSTKVTSGNFSKGTGLGLAICRQIVHAHHGEIWAENNPEGGACVCFTLPCGDMNREK